MGRYMQNKLFDNDCIEGVSDIEEITNLISDSDIEKCVGPLLFHANTNDNRKLSRVFVLNLIMICTGKKNKKVIEDIFKRMRCYEIFRGCEQGHSIVVRSSGSIRNILSMKMKK